MVVWSLGGALQGVGIQGIYKAQTYLKLRVIGTFASREERVIERLRLLLYSYGRNVLAYPPIGVSRRDVVHNA